MKKKMAQMPALIPKEVEIQRLKKIYIMVIMMGSIAASVEVDNFVDGSLHQTTIRDSAFTPAHWWLYSHFVALPLGWGVVAYVVRVYARLVELGAETPAKNPYVAEMYKLALEGKLYSRSIP